MLHRLPSREWLSFFEHISSRLLGKRAEIEIASLEVGAQVVTESLPVLGIFYDPKSDCIEVALEGVEHRIWRPREIYFDEPALGGGSLGLVDADGALQIIHLHEPLMLAAISRAR